MNIKCENCIHKDVCKFRPREDYPQFSKRIISQNCKNFIVKEEQYES